MVIGQTRGVGRKAFGKEDETTLMVSTWMESWKQLNLSVIRTG